MTAADEYVGRHRWDITDVARIPGWVGGRARIADQLQRGGPWYRSSQSGWHDLSGVMSRPRWDPVAALLARTRLVCAVIWGDL